MLTNESAFLPRSWRRGAEIARAVVGAGCLAAGLLDLPAVPTAWLLVPPALFAAYAVGVLAWSRLGAARLQPLRQVADLVFFLACGYAVAERHFWLVIVFFAYVTLAAALLHTWREVALALATAGALLYFSPGRQGGMVWAALFATGVTALVLALQKRALIERLSNATRHNVHFRTEAARAREAERQRIAADFHDGPLQSFISFQMRLEILRKLIERDPASVSRELEQLQELTKNEVADLRAFVRSMRPVEADGVGLMASVRRLVDTFQKDTGVAATFVAGPAEGDELEPPVELLQIVREALHNVQKHSSASRVAVALARPAGAIELAFDDDGTGFPFAGSYSLEELEALQLGPASIKRRVRSLGGELSLESRPGRGSSLRVRIPA